MAIEWENGIPILNGESYLSEVPQYTQELASVVAGVTPIGTVIPYAGDWGTGYGNLADPDVGAPFHLPCTGGVYDSDEFPLLSRVLTRDGIDAVTGRPYPEGHLFVDGIYGAPSHGMVESGQDINGHAGGHSDPFWDEGGGSLTGDATAWRPDTSLWLFQDGATAGSDKRGWHRITMKGFVVPDFRGRSPMGPATYDETLVGMALGMRTGSRRMPHHAHDMTIGGMTSGSAGQGHPYSALGWNPSATDPALFWGTGPAVYADTLIGGTNVHPVTGVNFLIFTGQVVASHAPMSTGLRDGSVHRLHSVTTAHMIHQRLGDPNLSDEEREMLEAQLNGEPWPLSGESMAEPTFKSTTPPQGKLP